MNQLQPEGTAPLSAAAQQSGFINEYTPSDFWFD
jgi:hypothetical protein